MSEPLRPVPCWECGKGITDEVTRPVPRYLMGKFVGTGWMPFCRLCASRRDEAVQDAAETGAFL